MDYEAPPTEIPKLTRFQRLRLWAMGYLYIGQYKDPSWSGPFAGPMPYYIVRCPDCGLIISTIRGSGYLSCKKCGINHLYKVGLEHYHQVE